MGIAFPVAPVNTQLFKPGGACDATFRLTTAGGFPKWLISGGWERISYNSGLVNATGGVVIALPISYRIFRLSIYSMVVAQTDFVSMRVSIDNGSTFIYAANAYQSIMVTGSVDGGYTVNDASAETGNQLKLSPLPIYAHGAYPNFCVMTIAMPVSSSNTQFIWRNNYFANNIGAATTTGWGVLVSSSVRVTHIWLLASYGLYSGPIVLEGIRRGD